MNRWLRVTLPPDSYIGVIVLIYSLFEFLPRAFGLPTHGGEFVINLAMMLYAAYRVTAFHPAFVPDYRTWLETTPWTSRLPLPVGPVHLVPQDALILGLLLGTAWLEDPALDIVSLALKFLFVYELCMTVSFACLRMPWFAYAIGFGLGLLCLFWNSPLVAVKAGIALYSITFLGLRRALNNFAAWSDGEWLGERSYRTLSLEKRIDLMKQKILGWPFDIVRPKDVAASIKYRDGIMLSLLFGWWSFVVIRRIQPFMPDLAPVSIFVGGFCQMAMLVRLMTYCWGYLPPISIWGRIITLRWIIPGYDRVFAAPVASLLVMIFGWTAFNHWGVSVEISAPATLVLVLLTLLNLGPSLKAWRLTGKHRMSPAMLMLNSQSELTQL
jgi:hypothetical protein